MGKPKKKTEIARIIAAAGYSLQGLRDTFISEAAFRTELALAAILIPLAFWVSPDGTDRALMIGSVFLVLIIEVLNAAIEAVVDRVGSEKHDLSQKAKDAGSAAVFLAMINLGLTWLLVWI